MNTKTMRLPPRRVLTSSNKRKEFDGYDLLRPHPQPHNPAPPPNKPIVGPPQPKKLKPDPAPAPSNQLLAGYLAHEYLTMGTLFGQPWDPTRPESADPYTNQVKPSREAEDSRRRYVEVCHLLKGESGPHLPGVVNPTQLARFLQM